MTRFALYGYTCAFFLLAPFLGVGMLGVAEGATKFDFIVRTPGNISVAPGGTVTQKVAVSAEKGTVEAVVFSVDGLPEGTQGTFSAPQCTPDCEVTLTITTSATTPIGRSSLLVAASNAQSTRRAGFALKVGAETGGEPEPDTGGKPSKNTPPNAPKPPKSTAKPFSFAMSNVGDFSVAPGGTAVRTVWVKKKKGTAEAVTFSASDLPPGATAAFATPQCIPDCETMMAVAVSAQTPPGRYYVGVVGTAENVTNGTRFLLKVEAEKTGSPKPPKAPKPGKEDKPKPPKNPTPIPPLPPVPNPPSPPTPPTPTPEEPAPSSGSGSEDSGVSDAPTRPANSRMLIVAQDGSGTHRKIQAAHDDSKPGDMIQVKNGTYSEYVTITTSGSRSHPITYMAYPGHRPRVGNGYRLSAKWIIIDGFEISGTSNGINITGTNGPTAGNSTIRNNWIHDNGFMGIFASSSPDLLIENNLLERNGVGPGNCTDKAWDGLNYSHCHGIYTGNYTWCIAHKGVTIRKNVFRGNSGAGWQNYTNPGCQSKSSGFLVENNVLIDNAVGFYVINMNNATIRNNTVVQLNYAKPQKDSIEMFVVNHGTGNEIINNVFYTTVDPRANQVVLHSWNRNADKQKYRSNAWYTQHDSRWIWSGEMVNGRFLDTYPQLTGDSSSLLFPIGTPPPFRSVGGDYRPTDNSPLKGRGSNCPKTDKDGKPRSGNCTIGAFE